jgi:DsbC/DsbD-like thiol-disulfide interchange protein
MFKKILVGLLVVMLPFITFSQISFKGTSNGSSQNVVKWKFNLLPTSETEYTFTATAEIEQGYHIFAIDAGGDGTLIATEITLEDANELDENWKSVPNPKTIKLDFIDGDIFWHENKVTFSKKIELDEDAKHVSGQVTYQVCNEEKCLPPVDLPFTVNVK